MPHFSQIKNKVLLSIRKFCDSVLQANFTINQIFIYNTSTFYLHGRRNTANKLWHIELAHQRTEPLTHNLRNILLPTAALPAPPAVVNSVYSLQKNGTLSLTSTRHVAVPYPAPGSRQLMPVFVAHVPASPANLFSCIYLNHWPRPKDSCAPPTPTNAPQKPPPFSHNLSNHTTK